MHSLGHLLRLRRDGSSEEQALEGLGGERLLVQLADTKEEEHVVGGSNLNSETAEVEEGGGRRKTSRASTRKVVPSRSTVWMEIWLGVPVTVPASSWCFQTFLGEEGKGRKGRRGGVTSGSMPGNWRSRASLTAMGGSS